VTYLYLRQLSLLAFFCEAMIELNQPLVFNVMDCECFYQHHKGKALLLTLMRSKRSFFFKSLNYQSFFFFKVHPPFAGYSICNNGKIISTQFLLPTNSKTMFKKFDWDFVRNFLIFEHNKVEH
jgi:hypothetical protein